MNLAEQVRGAAIRKVLAGPAFSKSWPARQAYLRNFLGPPQGWDPQRIVAAGDHLSEVFRLGAPGGLRTQQGTSAGGAVWEALVTYYLNMCYAGTDTVAVRRGLVPDPVRHALTVWSGPTKIAPDIDALVFHLPGLSSVPAARGETAMRRQLDALFNSRFADATVVVLACKTNWNDLIQIPMLWNLLYTARRTMGRQFQGVSIGSGTFSIDGLYDFSYAFVTVPSNKLSNFTSTSAPVLRARTLIGGHYWGYPTAPNIAPSISEFFAKQTVRVAPPRDAGVGLANQARLGQGPVDLAAFNL